ncbi:MAG: prepilin-type N-terminal cleavage/methylation domain-containing protein [Actinobacteria bacterium]|nr:prepilin-type N-terminal cleavage/methylation domain-containing protein [Actinomycetota bacterium]
MNREGAFSLVELMIVILIVGILVGIAVPVFLSARDSSESKVCQANLRTMKSAAAAYGASCGSYPASVSDLYPDYVQEIPVCPADRAGSYVVASGGGDTIPVFSCTFHHFAL